MAHPIVVDDETFNLVNNAIKSESIKDQSGQVVKKKAMIVKIAVAQFLNIRLVSDSDIQLMSEYGFTSITQLDTYNKLMGEIPKEHRGPVTMKELRAAIISNSIDKYMSAFRVVNMEEI